MTAKYQGVVDKYRACCAPLRSGWVKTNTLLAQMEGETIDPKLKAYIRKARLDLKSSIADFDKALEATCKFY